MPNMHLPDGARRLPDTARQSSRIQVSSDSTPGKSYVIALDRGGSPTCSCPSFLFRRNRALSCKHLSRHGHLLRSAPALGPDTPKPRRPARRKAIKPVTAMTKPETVWTPEDISEAAAAFSE